MIEIKKVYHDGLYGVETLWDCSVDDPTQGASEMSWFDTEQEQEEYYIKAMEEKELEERENSVASAKLDIDKNSCRLSDIQYWEDVTHIFDVDEYGEAVYETEHTDGDFRCYFCGKCDKEFKSFDEVREHINE